MSLTPVVRSAAPASTGSGLLLPALCAAVAACTAEISMVFAALPAMAREFGDASSVFWTVTIHYLMAASTVALSGRLGDLFGRRRTLLIVLGLALVGSLLSYASPSLGGIIAGRALNALGAAAIPLSFGLLREALPAVRVPLGVGIVASVAPIAAGVFMLVGGLLVDHGGWRLLFLTSATFLLLAMLLVAAAAPREAVATSRKLDIPGALLLPPAIAMLLMSIENAKHSSWFDARTLALAMGSLIVLGIWYRHESRQTEPLIDVGLLRNRQIGLANLAMALFGLGALQSAQLLSVLLQQPPDTGAGLGVSATRMGVLLAPFILLNLVGGPLSGRIAASRGGRTAALAGMVMTLIGWGGIALIHDSLAFVLTMAYAQSAGIALLFAALPNLVMEIAPPERTSEATGVLSVVRQFAASIGAQVVAFLLASQTMQRPGSVTRYPTDAAFTLTFGYVAVCCFVAVVIAMLLPRRQPRQV